ncbi:hypothetical protein [Alysiella crassa]|uniref:Uncharacterized protein n=1 Tax=Alysiella crassa TaxID=153491 RepID=A0A376BMU9_9NEIS|nr:hypothetical protein [Alysiella crassa]UOP06776.1 hypothetical protein LVJ80_13855 [Alysiella crassa]SSY71107.1 Uncharacterised protein [Alysiella crassa]
MVVQLNQENQGEMTVAQTVARLLQQLDSQENIDVIEFSQQQYFAPIYSREWYKMQVYRQACEVLSAGAADVFSVLFIILFLLIFVPIYWLPAVQKYLLKKLPFNPLVRVDFAQRQITFWQNHQCIQKIELGLASSILYQKRAWLFSNCNQFITLKIYDKNAKEHIIWEMETAASFGKSNPHFIKQIDDLVEKIAQKMNLNVYREA